MKRFKKFNVSDYRREAEDTKTGTFSLLKNASYQDIYQAFSQEFSFKAEGSYKYYILARLMEKIRMHIKEIK